MARVHGLQPFVAPDNDEWCDTYCAGYSPQPPREPDQAGLVWFTWWLGGITSAIGITPFIIVWSNKGLQAMDARHVSEAIASISLLVLACLVFFQGLLLSKQAAVLDFL